MIVRLVLCGAVVAASAVFPAELQEAALASDDECLESQDCVLSALQIRRSRGAALRSGGDLSAELVAAGTQAWMDAVVQDNDPQAVDNEFCNEGILVATAGVGLRFKTHSYDGWGQPKQAGTTIKSYFGWFATLPGLNITEYHNNIVEVAPTVWVNNAWVRWVWQNNTGLTARMTFVFKADNAGKDGMCLFELHSSQLPEDPSDAASSLLQVPLSGRQSLLASAAQQQARVFDQVVSLTTAWQQAVVVDRNASAVTGLFCEDAVLVAASGVGLRMQNYSEDGWGLLYSPDSSIGSYFEWFANLDDQAITAANNDIHYIRDSSPQVWVNNVWAKWVWRGMPEFTARMTFIMRQDDARPHGMCIFELHSSQLPLRVEKATPPTTPAPVTIAPATATTAATTTSAPAVAACAKAKYEKCGGRDFTGDTCCPSGTWCLAVNDWWAQCEPCEVTWDASCSGTPSPAPQPSPARAVENASANATANSTIGGG